ncbi:MAG: RNA methyltransferase [Acholeplasmataceae bacterium]|jgi:TrmH family RNA methyltransferase|nr:RNA methyltransferase [Acholeplasmataceae bacterium]
MIESRQNPKIKWLFKLQQKKYRDQSNSFLIYGDHAIEEALKSDSNIEIYTSNKRKKGILISEALMKELSTVKSFHDRLAIALKPEIKPYSKKILLLDGVQDPGNLGTLIRSAVGFGFKTIIANYQTVDFYNDKTVRATQGNLFHANLIKADLKEEIKVLKGLGYQIIGSAPKAEVEIKNFQRGAKLGLILGSEGSGISQELLAEIDVFVKIPTTKIESLNVAMAGTIMMYELGDCND